MTKNRSMMERAHKAVPTTFRGIDFKSRLEARFAKLLTDAEIGFIYEPARWACGYQPDFLIPEFRLYVEVKPLAFAAELDFFAQDIGEAHEPWVWVDSEERGAWSLIKYNEAFHALVPSNVVIIPESGTLYFGKNKKGEQKMFVEATVVFPGMS